MLRDSQANSSTEQNNKCGYGVVADEMGRFWSKPVEYIAKKNQKEMVSDTSDFLKLALQWNITIYSINLKYAW